MRGQIKLKLPWISNQRNSLRIESKTRRTTWIICLAALIGIIIASLIGHSHTSYKPAENTDFFETIRVVIYYNSICHPCAEYVSDLNNALTNNNVTDVQLKDLTSEYDAKVELTYLHERWKVPFHMQGFPVTVINEKFLFENYVEVDIIVDFLLEEMDHYEMIVVFQEDFETYKTLTAFGEVKEYKLSGSRGLWDIVQARDYVVSTEWILPSIVMSGLADGINLCGFAGLVFFASFLLSIERIRFNVLQAGLTYVGSLFVVYFLIGLGFLRTITLLNIPHLISKIGAVMIIVFGLINIKDYFWNGEGMLIRVPTTGKKVIINLALASTITFAVILGIMVGLSEFPCTGAIYVAILTLLATQTTYWQGLLYLVIYNLMFVMPLLIILFAASGGHVNKFREWRESRRKVMKLVFGLLMVSVGLIVFGVLNIFL